MSDKPIIQIDSDWKRQAQEEKRKLAEAEAQKKAAATPAAPPAGSARGTPSRARALPEASFSSLVQQTMTQALYYLGEFDDGAGQPVLSLDMAKHYIDLLGMLADKTRGNLTEEEQSLLDQVIYDTRSRFVSVARQMIV